MRVDDVGVTLQEAGVDEGRVTKHHAVQHSRSAEVDISVDTSDAYLQKLRLQLTSFPALSYWDGVEDGQSLYGCVDVVR
jgi:hypothetical protein